MSRGKGQEGKRLLAIQRFVGLSSFKLWLRTARILERLKTAFLVKYQEGVFCCSLLHEHL